MKFSYSRFKPGHPAMLAAVMLSVALAACGGSSGGGGGSNQSAGVGGTGIVAGKTTGFGSIFVNGIRYETDPITTQFIVDDNENALETELSVGMYVKLNVGTLNGVFTGKALEVVYDNEIEGPITAAPVTSPDGTQKTFMIFGQTITVDDIGTSFKGTLGNPTFGFDTIEANDVVEVSGFRTSATEISATYVEFKEDLNLTNSEVELRGSIQGAPTGTPPIQTFFVDGVQITTDGSTQLDVPGGVLVDNLNVEVEGIIQTQGPTTVLATKVEFEDEDFGDDVDDIRLQGIVSGFTNINNDFFIDSQRVNASTATLEPSGLVLSNGLDIEVEGEIVGGTLIADEVEAEEEDSKLRSYVNTVDVLGGTFEVHFPVSVGPMTVTVIVDDQTHFEDATGAVVTPPFSIDDLNPGGQGIGDYVRIEGVEVANNDVLATVVKRTNPDDKLKLKGIVDAYSAGVSITVLGIQYGLDGGTVYEPNPPNIAIDDLVEIEDDDDPVPNQADGIADEVEEE